MNVYTDVDLADLPDAVDLALDEILVREGSKFTNHKHDHPTKYGIRKVSAAKAGYFGPIEKLSRGDAKRIWALSYYYDSKFNMIFDESTLIGETVLDTSGPAGVKVAVTHLQRALVSFNVQGDLNGGIYGPDLVIDGILGAKTISMLRLYLEHRKKDNGEKLLATRLNSQQDVHYIAVALKKPGKRKFSFGWLKQRVHKDLPKLV